jgi:hypothetical protein
MAFEPYKLPIEASNSSTSLAKSAKERVRRSTFVDDNDIDAVGPNVSEELLEGRAVGGSARETAIVISGANQCPTGMSLTADIGCAASYWASSELKS